jgi:TonB family protein
MTPWLDIAVRSAAMLAAGVLFDVVFRSRAAALRHFVLATSVVAAFAVMPLSFVLPALNVPLDPAWETTRALVPTSSASADVVPAVVIGGARKSVAEGEPVSPRPPIMAIVWLTGFGVAFCSLLAAVYRLRGVARRGRIASDPEWITMVRQIGGSYGLRRGVRLIETDAPDLLATWGVRRPSVLLPSHTREWSRDRMHAVLCHELAHVRRHDWAVQMLAEALRTVLWFNPLIWITCTRLRRAGEQACDDAVLGRGVAARDYAAHLLDLARRCRRSGTRWVSATPMAHPSTLERRIVAMLNPGLNRNALTRRAALCAAVVLVAVALPVAALRGAQAPPSFFSGAVYDPTGAVMPGVALTLEDSAGGKQTAQTDSSGRFQIAAVAPGNYVLSAAVPGFRTLREEFELRDARDWDKAITLQIGTLQESISVRSTRITAPAAARPQGPAPVRVGGNIRVPRKLVDVKPVFPDSMRAAGREGVVTLDAIIGEDGSVTSVRVLGGEVHPDFAIAAAEAVRQWRFSPTLLNGRPVEVVMTVTVGFTLSN